MDQLEAYEAQFSEDWEERIVAAEVLINYGDDRSTTALLRLLIDADNTAVTERVAELLIARNDMQGASVLFAGRALAWAQQCDWINDVIREACQVGRFDIKTRAREILSDGNPWSRFGALEALPWMGLELES